MPQGGVLSPTLFQIYVNDLPLAQNENEKTLLFADDIAYLLKYKYKKGGKVDASAKVEAEKKAQSFLNKLEEWMSKWRLTLAPKKCSQITFSKARNTQDDELVLTLYAESIKSETNPKFLGVVFDNRLNFVANGQAIKKKIGDRLNLLKILSYDKTWRLSESILVKVYKSLVLSVLDYASITSGCLNEKTKSEFESFQNSALRIIFKKVS